VVAETVLGWALVIAGAVMLVTPGPGIVVVVAGLAVLARHYHFADRLKRAALARIQDSRTALLARRAARRAGSPRHGPSDDERPTPPDGEAADPDRHRPHAA
jgi:hypothetical protein